MKKKIRVEVIFALLALVLISVIIGVQLGRKNSGDVFSVITENSPAASAVMMGGDIGDEDPAELIETDPPPTDTPMPTEYVPALPIDINEATKEDFMWLPGIGDKLSDVILAHRDEHGDFEDTMDLLDVPGIGEGKYDAIKQYIVVGTVIDGGSVDYADSGG